jgi:hypothetical protein
MTDSSSQFNYHEFSLVNISIYVLGIRMHLTQYILVYQYSVSFTFFAFVFIMGLNREYFRSFFK